MTTPTPTLADRIIDSAARIILTVFALYGFSLCLLALALALATAAR